MTWIEITPWMVWFGWMSTELKSNSMHVHFKYVQFWSRFDLGQLMPIDSSVRRTDSKPGPPTHVPFQLNAHTPVQMCANTWEFYVTHVCARVDHVGHPTCLLRINGTIGVLVLVVKTTSRWYEHDTKMTSRYTWEWWYHMGGVSDMARLKFIHTYIHVIIVTLLHQTDE